MIRRVRQLLHSWDFGALEPFLRSGLKLVKLEGFSQAAQIIHQNILADRDTLSESSKIRLSILSLVAGIGEFIYQSFTEEEKQRYFPYNDIMISPFGSEQEDFVVWFTSLEKYRTSRGGTAYYSPHKPTIEIDGQQKTVAYSVEAIHRMGADVAWNVQKTDRFTSTWRSFVSVNDFHGYLQGCMYFERSDLFNPESRQYDSLGFSLFQDCIGPDWFNWLYVTKVLQDYDPQKKYYYRAGYCPAVIDGDFIIAKTFLLPGFAKTPEYGRLRRAPLPPNQRIQYLEQACEESRHSKLLEEADFSLIKVLHDYCIPQVVSIQQEVIRFRNPCHIDLSYCETLYRKRLLARMRS